MSSLSEYVQIVQIGHAASGTEPRTKPVINVHNFKRAAILPTLSKANIRTAFNANVQTLLSALLSVSYIADWNDIRFLDDPLDPYDRAASAIDGGVSGDSLPSIVNVTQQLKTGIRGRTYRGSKHYGPIAESTTTLDQLQATPYGLWQTFLGYYIGGFTDSDGNVWTPVVVSQKFSTFNPTTAVVSAATVTMGLTNQTLGYMRRRSQNRR